MHRFRALYPHRLWLLLWVLGLFLIGIHGIHGSWALPITFAIFLLPPMMISYRRGVRRRVWMLFALFPIALVLLWHAYPAYAPSVFIIGSVVLCGIAVFSPVKALLSRKESFL